MWRTILLVSCVLLAAASCANANNNLFLPGDAFFPTKLTEEDLAAMKADADEPPIITYSSLGGYEGAFCGYAGYNRARVPQIDARFLANLREAYRRVRAHEDRELIEVVKADGTKKLVETNGIHVLFYPADFKFPSFKLGLRYNEAWVAEAVKFGHPPRSLRLCSLIDDADAVTECWRDSTFVAGLPATLPGVELKPVPETTAPVVLQGPLKAMVLHSRPLLLDYYRPEDGARFFVVDGAGIVEWNYSDDEYWSEVEEDSNED